MIREEFLAQAAKNNLACLRNMRDVAIVLEGGAVAAPMRAFSAVERIRLGIEMRLSDAAEACAGLVTECDALLTQFTAAAENRTAQLLGLPIPRDLTVSTRKLLWKNSPPVGKLPAIYEREQELTRDAMQITAMLSEQIGALYDNIISGKALHAISVSGLEALGKIVDDYHLLARDMAKDSARPAACDMDALGKLTAYLAASFDPFYERETTERLTRDGGAIGLKYATEAVINGAKTTAIPILFDFMYRYASL